MKNPLNMVTVLILVVLGGIVWLHLKRPDWVAKVLPAIYAPNDGQPSPKPELSQNRKVARKSGKRDASNLQAPSGDASMGLPVEASGFVRAEIQKSFPIDRQIQQGAPQWMVLATYGQPAFRVTMADRGQLIERYIYMDKQTGRMTFVSFVNSRVTAAQTSMN